MRSSQLINEAYHTRFRFSLGDVLVRQLLLRDDKVCATTAVT
jgi:hypothetical protein